MVDVRTVVEKKREQRNKSICEFYTRYSKQMPECAPHRIFRIISNQVKMTVPGVRKIIIENGLYQPKKSIV